MLKAPWEAQQARSPDVPRERVVVSATTAARDTEPAPPESALAERDSGTPPSSPERLHPQPPAECACREWSGGIEGGHHPLCTFRKAWEAQQGKPAPQLVELETGAVIREATDDEVVASKAKAGEDGVGAIGLSDGKLYYVKEG